MKNPKREAFLIDVYQEYHPGRDAFNAKKYDRKQRAQRLLRQLRNQPLTWTVIDNYLPGTTAEHITANGKYSLD